MIKGLFQLTRPVNVLITLLSIWMGAYISGFTFLTEAKEFRVNFILAGISGGLICAGANAINDVFDIEIDRVNKPTRPLPAGLVTQGTARIFSIFLFLSGIILSGFIQIPAFLVAVVFSSLLFLYSWKLKSTVLWGNITVGLATGAAFVYGGIAIGKFYASLLPGTFAFLFHLGREILKDIEDVEGDSKNRVVTLPIRHGKNFALALATIVFLILIGFTIVPYYYEFYSIQYLVGVLVGVDGVLGYVLYSMWRDRSEKNMGRLSVLLKADMVVGLLVLMIG